VLSPGQCTYSGRLTTGSPSSWTLRAPFHGRPTTTPRLFLCYRVGARSLGNLGRKHFEPRCVAVEKSNLRKGPNIDGGPSLYALRPEVTRPIEYVLQVRRGRPASSRQPRAFSTRVPFVTSPRARAVIYISRVN